MRSGQALILLLLTLAGAAACAPREPGAQPPGPALLASVQATTFSDSVRFVLQVTNTSDRPVELQFGSGQSFDFLVTRQGQEIWRWSADRMFTQAMRSETLAPGATETYDATWAPPPQAKGEFLVTGVLTARERRVEQGARFRLE